MHASRQPRVITSSDSAMLAFMGVPSSSSPQHDRRPSSRFCHASRAGTAARSGTPHAATISVITILYESGCRYAHRYNNETQVKLCNISFWYQVRTRNQYLVALDGELTLSCIAVSTRLCMTRMSTVPPNCLAPVIRAFTCVTVLR